MLPCFLGENISHPDRNVIDAGICIAVFWGFTDKLLAKFFGSFEIIVQVMDQILHGDQLFFKHGPADGCQDAGQHG